MKVVVTGPESTGKTTLCKALAKHFNTNYVPEYARKYLQLKTGKYTKADLAAIAEGQIKSEDEYQQKNKLLLCDTSLEVIRIWSEWKHKSCDPFILEQANARLPDLFLLLTPDLPWKPDPLRENPDDRDELFSYYQRILSEYNTKVVEVRGDAYKRITIAIDAISEEF